MPRGSRVKSRYVWVDLLPLLEDSPGRTIRQDCSFLSPAVSAGRGYRLGNKGPGREHLCFTGRWKGKEITRSKSIVFLRLAVQAVPSLPPNEGAERTFTFIKNLSFQEKKNQPSFPQLKNMKRRCQKLAWKVVSPFFRVGRKTSVVNVLLCVYIDWMGFV